MEMDAKEVALALNWVEAKQTPNYTLFECPFHEDRHPSMAVYETHAHCYQCGYHAGPVGMLLEAGWSKTLALQFCHGDRFSWVKKSIQAKYKLPPSPPSPEWQEVMEGELLDAVRYLRREKWCAAARADLIHRGIGAKVWHRYGLGWFPEWYEVDVSGELERLAAGLAIPSRDGEGVLWSVKVRVAGGRPKYYQVGNPTLFGLDQLVGRSVLILVEAELDVLTASTAVWECADVLALRGSSMDLKVSWEVESYGDVRVCMDGDEAGRVAQEQILEQHPRWRGIVLPDGHDLGSLAKAGMRKAGMRELLLGKEAGL